MSRKFSHKPRQSEIFLGQKLKQLRNSIEMTQLELGKKTNDLSQQIDRYEAGAFIPLPKLEELAEALGTRIPKKIIRKISTERKLEVETASERNEQLIGLYSLAFDGANDNREDE